MFLQIILSSAYSQLFGDFMGNNYNERLEMQRPTSIFLCFEDEKFGFADKIKNINFEKSDNLLEIKKSDSYTFFDELMGSPAFLNENVPLIKADPPPFPDFNTDELEEISKNNQKERENNEELNKKCHNHKGEISEENSSVSSSEESENEVSNDGSSDESSSSSSSSEESENSSEDENSNK